MAYEKGEYQKARIVEYIADYYQKTRSYPKRREIADALKFSLSYALQLVQQMASEGTIKTQPPWDNSQVTQWTIIIGLKRGAAQSAKRVLLSRRAAILLERTAKSSQS